MEYGFVEFEDYASALRAIENLNGFTLGSKRLKVMAIISYFSRGR